MGLDNALIQTSLLGEAVDHGPALVFVADEDMRYAAVSAAACVALSCDRDEIVGRYVTDVCRYLEAPAEYDEMVERRGRTGLAEVTRKDGSRFHFRYVAGETRIAGMLDDVSVGWPE